MIVIRDLKTFCFNFDWPKDVDENLKHKIELIIKTNESLAENEIRNKIEQLLLNHEHGNNIHEHRRQQDEWTTYFVLNLSQYKNKKLKIIAPTWNDEFKLPDSFYSVPYIQDYIEYIIKKHETLTTIPPIRVYINKINNRLMFKIKGGYKLELQTPETMKLFGSTKKLIDKTKNGEKVPSIEVVEVVLVQCYSVDNQYQQKSEVLYTFTPNKSYAYLLNVEPSNLVFLKTYNTEFN